MVTEELIASVKKHEGTKKKRGRHVPYKDSVGVLTIGWGINLDGGISEEEAELLLSHRLSKAVTELSRYINLEVASIIGQPRLDVLYEMTFNMGLPKFSKFNRMWNSLSILDYNGAADEMLDSKWARQVGQRADTLSMQMRLGVYWS